jgi:hypothetical protein
MPITTKRTMATKRVAWPIEGSLGEKEEELMSAGVPEICTATPAKALLQYPERLRWETHKYIDGKRFHEEAGDLGRHGLCGL